ncbi:electron transport complex subunit RsxE [Candidatus Haliotispira prima]|uniref:Electron transport complex subunit RsxE n=1 Tax=Candidatus Haliotispira prima TaxID=3034016 RepID=A0ABY8ME07_9SPIO|nr:electron transport complex subunit RsxE [Candidatus Haliotispira prima]
MQKSGDENQGTDMEPLSVNTPSNKGANKGANGDDGEDDGGGNSNGYAKLQSRLVQKNPVLVDFIGLCPVLAVTNTVYNALGMSLGTSAVLLASSVIASSARRFIPSEVRIPAYIIIIASLVSTVDVLLRAYAPDLSRNLGAFVSLIVVNCLILGQIESFSSKNPPLASLWDAFCTSVGFTFALILVAGCRELLGSGSITISGQALWPRALEWSLPWFSGSRLPFLLHQGRILTPFSPQLGGNAFFLLTLPAGALFVVGYLAAFFAWLQHRHINKQNRLNKQKQGFAGEGVSDHA